MISQDNRIIFNGKLLDCNAFILKTNNRSFLYGDGLFESIRVLNGRVIFVEEHLKRLFRGMETLKMGFENNIIPDFNELFSQLLKANKIDAGAYIRLNVYRKDGGKYLPQNNNVDFLIEVFVMENKFSEQTKKVKLGIYSQIKKPVNDFNLIKSNNAQLFVMAAIFASENDFDEVLILNENNEIIEASSSNLFLLKGSKLMTPPLKSGALAGIMRKRVLEIAEAMTLQIIEKCPTEKQLLTADEIFVTNAIIGLKAVDIFRDKTYEKRLSSLILKKILAF